MRTNVGRYAITGTLGEGGMGVVYSAYDDRLGLPIAIKMIRASVAQADARDRLWREARAAAKVNHPAICQLYEICEEGGELFLVMELLQGESLAARISRGPAGVAEVGTIALGMLAGYMRSLAQLMLGRHGEALASNREREAAAAPVDVLRDRNAPSHPQ